MRQRAGYTLVELVVSAGLASLLMGGLASALFLASSALPTNSASAPSASRASRALAQFVDDARHANRILALSNQAAAWETPDRNGDGRPEKVRYDWSGEAGAPLLYQLNDQGAVRLLDSVQSFRLATSRRLLRAEAIFVPDVKFRSYAESTTNNTGNSTTVEAPAGVAPGDLLLVALATDGTPGGSVTTNVTWSGLASVTSSSNAVTLLVGWRLAEADEPATYAFSWTNNEKHYAWVMRFTGHDANNPIGPFAQFSGWSNAPTSPNVVPNAANSRIVRIGAFDGAFGSNAQVALHQFINFGGPSGSGAVRGGSGHAIRHNPTAGGGDHAFGPLTSSTYYCTVTVALRPSLTP
jgi:type II secretory pathway pseudopilin PulG